MITAPIITTVLNAIILGSLALTPVQRWKAAGDRFDTSFFAEHWFLLTAAALAIILAVLLLVVYRNYIVQQRKMGNKLFIEYAEKSGLSERERQFLLDIATKAGLKQIEAIFTMRSAFDHGAAIMIEESIARQQTSAQTEQLRAELSFLREKLGFQKRALDSVGLSTKAKRLSSRQIPIGKTIHMARRTSRVSDSIESTVTENNDIELVVKLIKPVKIIFGEVWCARYYFGASVWEFDTSVVSCNGDILVLNHSDDLRFVNRRRFLRVPVNNPAFIAHFPFTRASVCPDRKSKGMKSFRMYRSSASASESSWGPPEFVPAVVTELAGPGLRIEAPLEVKVDDRVLVVLKLDEEEDQDSARQKLEGAPRHFASQSEAAGPPSKIIEDIGEVRHTKIIPNGFSIAVELIGLSDSDVNELIRATNTASLRTRPESQDVPVSEDAKKDAAEPAVAQGV